MLGTDRHFRAVKIRKLAGSHVDRTHAQAHVLSVVDAVEIDQSLKRRLEDGGVVVTDDDCLVKAQSFGARGVKNPG